MKILVFSDSHGVTLNMKSAIDEHLRYGGVDCVFFLGDGVRDVLAISELYPNIEFHIVSGNCDSFFRRDEIPSEKTVVLGGKKFFLTHGHNYDVKYDYTVIASHGSSLGADVVFFGHTHRAEDTVVDSSHGRIRVINPGSCRGGWLSSYATVYVEGGDVVCGFGSFD